MGLRAALETLLNMGKSASPAEPPPASMVLLLKEARFPSLEQLRHAAERAYKQRFSGDKNARYCVYQEVLWTIARIGPHMVSFMFYTKPYGADLPALAKAWKLPDQRNAWDEHTAWMAIDYAKGSIDFESRYALLARLCAELYDDNCVGLYLPRERALVPGEISVRDTLSRAMANRAVGLL